MRFSTMQEMLKNRLSLFYKKTIKEYKYLLVDFQDYIQFYGPIKDLIYSPYLHLSILISFFTTLYSEIPYKWAEHALGSLPSLLGFSIGGYALIATFGDKEFRKFLAKTKNNDKSILLIINGTFIHFILVQTIAILIAHIAKSLELNNLIINFFLSIPFIYSIIMCTAVAFEIKTISKWYKDFLLNEKK